MQLNKLAFTLIELLVVIAIIGILSGLIVVSMSGVTQKATIAKAQVFSNSLRNSLMLNIVAQYTFDDIDSSDYDPSTKILNTDSGNIPDSWSTNEGTAAGGPTLKEGSNCVSGKCLSFDGTDDYIAINNFPLKNDYLTISLWVNQVAVKNGARALYGPSSEVDLEGLRYLFRLYGSGGTTFYTLSDTENTESNINKWKNIVAVVDSANDFVQGYIDGQPHKKTSTIRTDLYSTGTQIAYIGRYPSGQHFNGYIDDVRIYNAAISASQIQEQYFAGLNKLLASGNISIADYQSRLLLISNK